MKNIFYLILIVLITSSCFIDEKSYSENLVNDLKLEWWGEPINQTITFGMVRGEFGGLVIIPETVYEVGFNNDYLIAKVYPNKEKELQQSLFNFDKKTKHYKILNPKDTIYLDKDDEYYEKDKNWYHKSNGYSPPDGFFPYKDSTYYYIIDMRKWNSSEKWKDENLYKSKSIEDFNEKRKKLKIPDSLSFTIITKELK